MTFDPSVTRRKFIALAATVAAQSALYAKGVEPSPVSDGAVSLAGHWRFLLDRDNRGVGDRWFATPLPGELSIALPGILQTQGFGDDITAETPFVAALPHGMDWTKMPQYAAYTRPGNIKMPFLSQPVKHYLGVAWYQREIEIPRAWRGKRVTLTLERTRWETSVFLDEQACGSCRTLVAPHEYDLGLVAPGKHRLSIRVDTSMLLPYRPDAHSISDAEGGTWNGIVGRIELSATPPVWIDDAQVFPNLANKSADIHVAVGNATGKAGSGWIRIASKRVPIHWDEHGGTVVVTVPLKNARAWSEFSPEIQRLTVVLSGKDFEHRQVVKFGMREIRADGKRLLLNNELLHVRGTHDGGGFPLTGYPATDLATWKRIISTCQEWGFNAIRFHSWCPPEAAFTAADELGFYLQPDCGMWNSFDAEGRMLSVLNDETKRILRAYGNHPSMIFLNATNEPAGHYNEQLPLWDRKWRAADSRRLYADGTGRPAVPKHGEAFASDYLVENRDPTKRAPGRGPSGWFGENYESIIHEVPLPIVGHEIGQWCAYPNFDVIAKFKGYMVASNYEIWRDSAAAHGVLQQNRELAYASGRFQLACYKEEIEASLRTPSYSGYEMLDLHDYLGQGGALVGVLDAFWENKGYAQPAEYRQFNNATVPLASLKSRVFRTSDTLHAEVELAHFGPAPLEQTASHWSLLAKDGRVVTGGAWPARHIPRGKSIPLGTIDADLRKLTAPAQYTLAVQLDADPPVRNEWKLWIYPASVPPVEQKRVVVTSVWNHAEASLRDGGTVLFTPDHSSLPADSPRVSTVPIFWNRLMNLNGAWMLGFHVDAAHPALSGFPTESHCDWQWIDAAANAPAIRMAEFPAALRPIVQPIDDWNRNWKLGLMFECAVGQGRLFVSSIDLHGSQLGTDSLRASVLRYMESDRFAPPVAVDLSALQAAFRSPNPAEKPTSSKTKSSSPDLEDPGQIHLQQAK